MSSVKCPECNLTNWSTAITCKRCGNSLQPSAITEATLEPQLQPAEQNFTDQNQHVNQEGSDNEDSPSSVPSSFTEQQNYPESYPHQTYQPAYNPYYQPENLKTGLAITAMVLGIVSFFTGFLLIGILIAPIGLILGIIALIKANKHPHIYGGKGFAIAGIATSSIIVLFVPIILAIAIPNLLASRRAANEASAISTLRVITTSQTTYMASSYGKCGDVQTLIATKLLDVSLANSEKNGYRFLVVNLPGTGCEIHATPVSASYGSRSFYYSTKDGIIRGAAKKGLPADKNDMPLNSDNLSVKW